MIECKKLKPTQIAEEDRDYFLERRYPAFGNLVPRDVASRAAKERCDAGYGIEANDTNEGVYLDFSSEVISKWHKYMDIYVTIGNFQQQTIDSIKSTALHNIDTHCYHATHQPTKRRGH